MSPLNFMHPSNQNDKQRKGFFVAAALAAAVILIHYPFDGYKTEDIYYSEVFPRPVIVVTDECRSNFQLDVMKLDKKQLETRVDCTKQRNPETMTSRTVERPMEKWESLSPLVPWFATVRNAGIALGFVFFLGGLWLWVFRTTTTEQ